jgi:lysophospholipase L1-like esterase
MKLQTNIPIQKTLKNHIGYTSKIFLLGSCFSENIGAKLSYYKFQSHQNPFGILFHPIAIENLITRAINNIRYTAKEVTFNNERWHCLDAHSSLSSSNKKKLLANLNSGLGTTKEQLTAATHIIITLGTSWIYKHIETSTTVANCHKIPQNKFSKELLAVTEVSESLARSIALIRSVNKHTTVTLTISPVRHLKDGFIENTRSKAHLIAGIHAAIHPIKNIHYFPSYEIVMDELRDYRFYEEDMVHPNKTAINYIWEKFVAAYFSEESQVIMQEVETIQKGIAHRPFHEASEQHAHFLMNLEDKKGNLLKKFPFMKF